MPQKRSQRLSPMSTRAHERMCNAVSATQQRRPTSRTIGADSDKDASAKGLGKVYEAKFRLSVEKEKAIFCTDEEAQ